MRQDEVLELFFLGSAGYGFAFVLGALFGSFANVWIYRMPPTEAFPNGQSIVSPGSRCGDCGKDVRWYDNIPLFSYFLLRGQCRFCKTEFSARYLFVEAAMAMLFVATYHFALIAYEVEPISWRLIRFGIYAAFVFVLVIIAFIDLDHKLILDKITYPAIPLFYGAGLLLPEQHYSTGLIGAAVGYGLVRLISDGYYHLTGREGLGYGDGKLLALVGALFGWQGVFVSLFGGSLLGSTIGIAALVIARRSASGDSHTTDNDREQSDGGDADDDHPDAAEPSLRHAELPFGPFLVVGALVYLYIQPWLLISFAGLGATDGPIL